MAGLFFHSPGRIRIASDVADFDMTDVEFLVEEPDYEPPDGAIWRYYVQPSEFFEGHHLVSDGSTQRGESFPWPEGDAYIANAATYQTNVLAARAAAADPPPTDDEKADAILNRADWDSAIQALATRFSISAATLRAEIRAILVVHPDL